MSEQGKANIGVVGLAVMGSNLARNLASREGNTVAVYNRTFARTETLVTEHPEAGFVAAETIDEFVASLATPRTAIIMVQAGAGTDAVISELVQRFEPGDIIVDGGNEWCAPACLLACACLPGFTPCPSPRPHTHAVCPPPPPPPLARRYENTERRQKEMAALGIFHIGMGVSGGEEGARRGAWWRGGAGTPARAGG